MTDFRTEPGSPRVPHVERSVTLTRDQRISSAYLPVQGELEERLAEIWTRLLEIDRVGRQDDFFWLGGDSLMAFTLSDQVARTFGVEPMATAAFDYPTIEQMAALIQRMMSQHGTAPAQEQGQV